MIKPQPVRFVIDRDAHFTPKLTGRKVPYELPLWRRIWNWLMEDV